MQWRILFIDELMKQNQLNRTRQPYLVSSSVLGLRSSSVSVLASGGFLFGSFLIFDESLLEHGQGLFGSFLRVQVDQWHWGVLAVEPVARAHGGGEAEGGGVDIRMIITVGLEE